MTRCTAPGSCVVRKSDVNLREDGGWGVEKLVELLLVHCMDDVRIGFVHGTRRGKHAGANESITVALIVFCAPTTPVLRAIAYIHLPDIPSTHEMMYGGELVRTGGGNRCIKFEPLMYQIPKQPQGVYLLGMV